MLLTLHVKFASVGLSWGSFAMFLGVGSAFLIADQYLVPPMKAAASEGAPVPFTGVRMRFEVLTAFCLLFVFWKTVVPPLMTLAMSYAIG